MLLNGYAAEKIAHDKMAEARRMAENDRLVSALRPKTSTKATVTRAVVALAGLIAAVLIEL